MKHFSKLNTNCVSSSAEVILKRGTACVILDELQGKFCCVRIYDGKNVITVSFKYRITLDTTKHRNVFDQWVNIFFCTEKVINPNTGTKLCNSLYLCTYYILWLEIQKP
jgi:hypothetical protein